MARFSRNLRWLLRRLLLLPHWLSELIFKGGIDPLPLAEDLAYYNRRYLRYDLSAALNVALLAFPQAIAYAVVADLPIIYGIAGAIVACMVAPLFAGSRWTIIGPTNATAFLLFSFFATHPDMPKLLVLPLIMLMAAAMLIVAAFLRLADLLQYVSRSVIVGYISGAAVLIASGQFSHCLGIAALLRADAEQSTSFFGMWQKIYQYAPQANLAEIAIALMAMGLFFGLQKKLPRLPNFAICLAVTAILSFIAAKIWHESFHYERFAAVSIADLKIQIPDFYARGIFELMLSLFGIAFALAFLAALENSVMSKSLAGLTGERLRPNQDMFALGMANLISVFFSAMPASGSPTRSMLNYNSRALSRLSAIYTAILVLLILWLMGNFFTLLPKAAVAALIICIAASLFNKHNLRVCLFATKSDAIVLVGTFIASLLLPLHIAIFIGVGFSLALFLRKVSRPQLVEYDINDRGILYEKKHAGHHHPAISIVHVEGSLYFGAADLFRAQIRRTCEDPSLRVIILRMRNARHLDATSVLALEELAVFLQKNNRHLIISGASREVFRILLKSGVVQSIGKKNIFLGLATNPNLSTRYALKYAQQLIGSEKAEIRIFVDEKNKDNI